MTLEVITADALAPLHHGFFSRRGGASSGVFAGLNCGPGSSDQAEIVALNRSRAAEALGVAPEQLVTLHQIHSAEAVALDTPPATRPRADGMATATPGLALGVLTADCMPVLFADPEAGVIGAAHAGWRGARAGVLEATLARMAELGAEAGRVTAVIGPAISQSAYEVGPEVMATFLADAPENARFFAPGHGDRSQFDLPGYGLARLREAGVGRAEWIGQCTYADPARFYSFRRATHAGEADYGRLLSAIRL
ncbi:peptidoglycan editing factor PgeF [Rhodosalinus sp.]|uniref:peptidoglycan editing factor PgeF n=1 Tax=Rhodosalinus sp. TaxID=2047741 RepID=UPI0035615892